MSASFVGQAFWQDVLDSRYSGFTSRYAATNLSLGYNFNSNRVLVLKVNNISNAKIQQHIFGDLLKRQISLEFKINMPKKNAATKK